MWEPQCLTTLWAFTACYRDSFAFLFIYLFTYVFITIHNGESPFSEADILSASQKFDPLWNPNVHY
jgi:hypothetical protein